MRICLAGHPQRADRTGRETAAQPTDRGISVGLPARDRVARDHGLRLRSGNLLPVRLAGGDRDKTGETRHNRRRGVHRDGRDGLPDAKVPLPERQGDYAFRRDCRRNRVAGLMMLNGQGAGLTTRPSVPINRL